ncbi:MAG: hypothetical protein PHQ40_03020 [Anaerolineaceae bacterium]|nr:hypothetical protein [Anaerolineaceae bacterium]
MGRFAGSPEMLALIYGAFTRFILRSGNISQPVSITCGLPLDTLSGEEARTTVESIQRWMKADHIWKANDQEYHLNVTEVRVTSQPAGALFDYVLNDKGKIIPERHSANTQKVGIVSIGMNTTELLVVRGKAPVKRFTGSSTTGVRRLLELVTCLQYLFDVFFGKSFNGMRLKFRSSDFYSRVGVLELHMQPAEKGTKRDPHIANGLGRQWLFTTIEAHRLVLGAQPGHVTSKVGSLNFRNTPISNVFQPMVEHVFVGGNCALA